MSVCVCVSVCVSLCVSVYVCVCTLFGSVPFGLTVESLGSDYAVDQDCAALLKRCGAGRF